jgi:hypothetical protein
VKQYNKLCELNTADMNVEELTSHQDALRLIKKDLNFSTKNTAEMQNKDDSEISICCILNWYVL